MFRFKWNPMLNADGGIGAASDGTSTAEPASVDAGDDNGTSLDTGTASVSGQQTDTTQTDITQQESFAKRLKQEKQALEQQYQPHVQTYQQLENISKSLGFASVSDYLAAVDEQVQQQRIQQEAQRMQLDPETYNQFFAPVKSELEQTKAELAKLKQADLERQIRADYERLSTQYPDFKQHEDAIWELATSRRMPLEDAYKLVAFDARIAAAKIEAEQQVLANVTGRDQKQVLPASDKGVTPTLDPTNMSLKDIQSISERVQRGERITF